MKVCLSYLLITVGSISASSVVTSQWNHFKAQHEKVYSTPEEEAARKAIFAQNLAKIEEHNAKGLSWTEGINQFSDLTKSEFVSLYSSGLKPVRTAKTGVSNQGLKSDVSSHPPHVDWRDKGVITPVRNQGQCGSCWAFAASSVLASYAALSDKNHDLLEISPQHLVSCAPNPLKCGGTGGCYGSVEPIAFTYASLIGLVTESDYPYVSGHGGNDDHCDYDSSNTDVAIKAMGYETLPYNDAEALMTHLATKGPVATSVAASDWSFYFGGVFDGCDYNDNMVVNHAVVMVGYGTDADHGDYWLIKNSWGEHWGEDGYIRLRRQATPQCATDYSPMDGSGCQGSGVETVKVCGTCAVVSDNSYPIGVTFQY